MIASASFPGRDEHGKPHQRLATWVPAERFGIGVRGGETLGLDDRQMLERGNCLRLDPRAGDHGP